MGSAYFLSLKLPVLALGSSGIIAGALHLH